MCFFYLHTAILQKYIILSHLFFLLHTTIQPKIRVHTDVILYYTRPFDKKFDSS